MTRLTLRTAAALATLALPAAVFAGPDATATVSFSSNVISLQDTNWDEQLVLQQYQGSGTLTGVKIELFGSVAGSLLAESTDSQPAQLTLTLASSITLALPTTGTSTLSVTPKYTQSVNASAFDGVEDFSGTSGFEFNITTPIASSASVSFIDAANLAWFTGTGTLHLAVSARDQSLTVGAANYADGYTTQAGAFARVTYTYEKSELVLQPTMVPEPATWALMFAGLGMVGMLAGRRRAP